MGRKRGLPRAGREKAVAEEAAQALDADRRDALMQSMPDDALFIVDSRGSERKRRKVQKEAKDKKVFSKNEKKLVIEKYLGKTKSAPKPALKKIEDLWGDEGNDEASTPALGNGDDAVTTKTGVGGVGTGRGGIVAADTDFLELRQKPGQQAKRPKPTVKDKAKLGVCHPGQSYNPTEEDHDDVLASAVAVELRREEAMADEQQPVSRGMSKETLAILVGDEEGDASSDEGDRGELPLSIGQKTPATGKLTRTQRNRQARRKQAMYEQIAKKRRKELLKSIDDVPALEMEVAEQERLREERRQTKRLLKAQKADLEAKWAAGGGVFGPSAGITGAGEALGGPMDSSEIIAGRSVPVNLGEELHGSLRQLRTQGSVLLDKVELLKASRSHPDRRRAKERARKAPKGFRKKHKFADRYKDE